MTLTTNSRSPLDVLRSINSAVRSARLQAAQARYENTKNRVRGLVNEGTHGSDAPTAAAEMERSPQLKTAMRERWLALARHQRLLDLNETHQVKRM